MSDARAFEYTSDIDRNLFAAYGLPILTPTERVVADASSSMREIGLGLSAGIDSSSERVFFPAHDTLYTAAEMAAELALMRQKDQKALYYVLYKPVVGKDNQLRVAACFVRDLGQGPIESQMVPADQPPSAEICLQLIAKTYSKYRSTVPNNGREYSPSIAFEPYTLNAQEQVNFLARIYREKGYGKQRDPIKDQYSAYDKSRNYSDELLDALEEGVDVGGWLKGTLHRATNSFINNKWVQKVPFLGDIIGEGADLLIDFTGDTVGSVANFYADAVGDGLKDLDPFIRGGLNLIPGADHLSYAMIEAPNTANIYTGDLIDTIKLRLP